MAASALIKPGWYNKAKTIIRILMPGPAYITDYLEKNAHEVPDNLALVTDTRSMTWQELLAEVEVLAAHLTAKLPADKQAAVGLLLPNSWQHVVANLAVVHAGHMALPIDVIFKRIEIDAIVKQIDCRLVIADNDGLSRLDNSNLEIINLDSFEFSEAPQNPAKLLRLGADVQIASLFFTSGTTGRPKVVPNTHRNHIWNIETCTKAWEWTSEDSQLVSARLSHMLGLVMGLSGSLYHGGTMYLQDRFSQDGTLSLLASGKITMFSHGPQVYTKLLEAPGSYDLAKVRLFISGSGPLAPAIWQKFKDKFGAEILEVYGTTESGRITSNLLNERVAGSPGRPLPGVEVKVDDGQITVRSPGVFPGYWQNEVETKKAFSPDGFYKTGDLGELVNGRLTLKGRIQEKIRRQGYTISPRDIEWALHTNPRLKEVVVVGSQQADTPNDQLAYFVVGELNKKEINDFCQANLPSIWRPDQIYIMDKLPRTRTGKPDLAKLKAMLN